LGEKRREIRPVNVLGVSDRYALVVAVAREVEHVVVILRRHGDRSTEVPLVQSVDKLGFEFRAAAPPFL
ncbi:MAG: hypothetical protein ACJ8C9_14510, partial [Microvirga sp.]